MTFQYFLFDTYIGYFIMALPLAIIISIIYGIIKFKNDKNTSLYKKIISCLLICYLVGLVELVLCLDIIHSIWYDIIYHMNDSGKTLPFLTFDFNFVPNFWNHLNGEAIGNLLMFIPFGILFSMSQENYSIRKTLKYGFLCTIIIEILQPIFGRAFDINDLILNTLGVLIGTIIYHLIRKILKK